MSYERTNYWVRQPEPDPPDMAPVAGTNFMLNGNDSENYEQVRAEKLIRGPNYKSKDGRLAPKQAKAVVPKFGNRR